MSKHDEMLARETYEQRHARRKLRENETQAERNERHRQRKMERIADLRRSLDLDPRGGDLEETGMALRMRIALERIADAPGNHAIYLDGEGTHAANCIGCLVLAALGREE